MRTSQIFTLVILIFSQSALAHTQFESGVQEVPVVELFSSEGCSSCPPADRWFSSLKSDPGLFKSFIPLVFHVDYWDYLGWKDELSKREYTERQLSYSREWGNNHVYTPGVVLNGHEWSGWRSTHTLSKDTNRKVGNLTLEMVEKGKFLVSFSPATKQGEDLKINVAILGMGVGHKVSSGENRGETLNHDFVVLQVKSDAAKTGPKSTVKDSANTIQATIQFDPKTLSPKQLAAVAWITTSESIRPIQAVGGYLP